MSAQNIFSYCVGGLAFISTISSVMFYCRLYLPSTQLRVLDEILMETKNIYNKANDERLLPTEAAIYAQTRLRRYEDEADALREVTYRARSCIDNLHALLLGHTRQIMGLAKKVRYLRALLMTTSQREKNRKRQEQARCQTPTLSSENAIASECTPRRCIDDVYGVSETEQNSQIISTFAVTDLVPIDNSSAIPYQSVSSPGPPPSPADENRRASICFVCSFLGWWAHTSESSQQGTSLPSFVTPEAGQNPPNSNSSTLSRVSEGSSQPSTSRPYYKWFSPVIPTFLRHPTRSPIPGDTPVTPLPSHDSTV